MFEKLGKVGKVNPKSPPAGKNPLAIDILSVVVVDELVVVVVVVVVVVAVVVGGKVVTVIRAVFGRNLFRFRFRLLLSLFEPYPP